MEGRDFQVDGVSMYKLYAKLKSMKVVLKVQNLSCFGNLKQKIMEACENLDMAQKDVIANFGRADCLLKERECLHAYNAKNTVTHLWDEKGNRVEDVEQIKQMAIQFYEKLLCDKAAILEKEVTAEEIRETLFHMPANKAPGPDGLSAEFFKASWSIVGEGVVAAIKGFFASGKLLKEVNATILTLVPKKVNPSTMGDFKPIACCRKGLRQGDPCSPYLFVLAMEVFSRIIVEHTGVGSGFQFHPKCVKLKLTHLCFADDLIFSTATLNAITIVKVALLEFEELSGLKANLFKSSFFCSGISDRVKHVLLGELGMNEGHLPVRYLGVPLISTKLFAADCGALLDRITGLIDSWLSKHLSYAGRLQLLSSVLYSLQVYWTGIFILPKKVIQAIEQKFNRFLWNGKTEGSAKAKVSWQELCYPKKEGGLGLKQLEIWNQFAMLRHVWSLFARSGILYEVYGHRAVYDARSTVEAKLSSVILNGEWHWRPARSDALVEIQARLPEIRFAPYDNPLWTASRKGIYVSSETWELLREKKEEIAWWKLVWFSYAIPKHAFILWLTIQDRLVTGSVIYNLWRTRNELKHSGQPSTEEQLLKKIIWEVRSRLAGKGKFPRTRENLVLASLWNLPADLLL
ncbi:uncharacterized protein LOC132163900 [Corylus avellana]|uniref:uncharacterized protein LOC132163900 n=1 Tax=Corylus avellana TaxID=13451 RepID=UPI00286C3D85|nr:uncharacterized protein LOC132163900 [Corylus avellana]